MPIDISRGLKKYIPIFQEAHEQGINEAKPPCGLVNSWRTSFGTMSF